MIRENAELTQHVTPIGAAGYSQDLPSADRKGVLQ